MQVEVVYLSGWRCGTYIEKIYDKFVAFISRSLHVQKKPSRTHIKFSQPAHLSAYMETI
jgi:hypothetical protein